MDIKIVDFKTIALVGSAGFIGTILRYGVAVVAGSQRGLSTLIVNIVGSFLIGWVYGWSEPRFDSTATTILAVGFLGGFTTFSAFSAETLFFLKEERWLMAGGYILVMIVLGLLATFGGMMLSRARG